MGLSARSLPVTAERHYSAMYFYEIAGLVFPCIGLGTYPMRGDGLKVALDAALSHGYTLFDTAFKYGNESEIGHCLGASSSSGKVIIQTKISVTQLTQKRFLGIRVGRNTERDALQGSLKRLVREKLDVYLVHSPASGFDTVYPSLMQFRKEGLVSVIGVCGFQEDHLRTIKNKFGEFPSINQIEVHPYNSNRSLIDFCKENGIAVEARSPFAHGDAMNDFMMNPVLSSFAKKYDKTVPQIIIKWLIQQGLIVISKSGNPVHISANIDVFDFEMTELEMKAIGNLNRNQSFGFVSSRRVAH